MSRGCTFWVVMMALCAGAEGVAAQTAGSRDVTIYVGGNANTRVLSSTGGKIEAVPIQKRRLLSAVFSVDGRQLKVGDDFVALDAPGARTRLDGAQVIYGGVIEDTANQISAADARGRVVVFTTRDTSLMALLVTSPGKWFEAAAVIVVNADQAFEEALRIDRLTSIHLWPDENRPLSPRSFLMNRSSAGLLFDAPLSSLAPGALGGRVSAELQYGTPGG